MRNKDINPYDLSQVKRKGSRKPRPGSTRPSSDDPYSACTVVEDKPSKK